MVLWDNFWIFALLSAILWVAGALASYCTRRKALPLCLSIAGSLVLASFIAMMWISLKRPVMRTMGETRLWYSFFLSLIGIVLYKNKGYRWMLAYGSAMALMFLSINLFKPEIHSAEVMPALQSPWFVPHVSVYMFAYALLGAALIYGIWLSFRPASEEWLSCDSLVRMGWAFLTLGMTMGALWAKEAWGDWWAWDPKETWAFATWLGYMLYLHARPRIRNGKVSAALLLVCFLMLCMCWFGVNFLPSAQGVSIHAYN